MSAINHVFIIGSHTPIVLHPFDRGEAFDAPEGYEIVGRYGTGDAPAATDSIRASLYVAMEKGARRYFLDRGYYMRVFMTAFAFVAVYLLMSIVVRDPVPLIDELLLGVLAAAAVFFASERKALSSPKHLDVVLRLRRAIDAAFFTESRVVDLVESWRDEALALGPAAFYKSLDATVTLGDEEKDEAAALCSLLAYRWRKKTIVAELYDASLHGKTPGSLLDRAARRLGAEECALALAYLRLIPLLTVETT